MRRTFMGKFTGEIILKLQTRLKFGALMAAVIASVAPIIVAAPASASATLHSECGTWQQATIFQTSTTWARISERTCIEWYDDNEVRARADARVDWPTNCTLSVSGCALLDLKAQKLSLDALWVGVGWNFTGRTGTRITNHSGTYGWAPWHSSWKLSVTSDWMTQPTGAYRSKAAVYVDVKSDNQGLVALDPSTVLTKVVG
jgi:hypothetical protein